MHQNNADLWERIDACPVCKSTAIEQVFTTDDYHHGTTTNVAVAQCRDCTSGFTNPRPTEEGILKFYPDDYEQHNKINADEKDQSLISGMFREAFLPLKDLLTPTSRVKLADRQGQGRVLDVGCGRGRFLADMAKHGWDTHGIDLEQKAVNIANDRRGVVATCAPIQKFETKGNFDLVTMWHSLEHMHNPRQVLGQVKELIADDGRLIVEVPNFDSFLASYLSEYWYDLDVPRHLVHFTPRSIQHLGKETGFNIESIHWRPSARSLSGTLRFAKVPIVPPRPIAIALSNVCAYFHKSSRILAIMKPGTSK